VIIVYKRKNVHTRTGYHAPPLARARPLRLRYHGPRVGFVANAHGSIGLHAVRIDSTHNVINGIVRQWSVGGQKLCECVPYVISNNVTLSILVEALERFGCLLKGQCLLVRGLVLEFFFLLLGQQQRQHSAR